MVDFSIWEAVLRLVIFLPLVMVLAYVAVRYGLGHYYRSASVGGGMRVVERISLSPKSFLAVVKVGDHYYLVAAGEGGTRLLQELSDYQEKEAPVAAGTELTSAVGRWLARVIRGRGGDV